MSPRIVIFGTGGHAKVAIATAQAAGFEVVAAYDDDTKRHGAKILGIPIAGNTAQGIATGHPGVLAIGDNKVRQTITQQHENPWATLVHPQAIVHESVTIGPGTVIFAGVVVQPDTTIGAHAILNTSCSVDHDCTIGPFAHIGPGANLCGTVTIGEGTLIGVGSALIPGVSVGAWSVVGGGAAVIADHGERQVLVGIPAIGSG